MRAVLLSGGRRLGGAGLVQDIGALATGERDVVLVSRTTPAAAVAEACSETVVLGPATAGEGPPPPPQRGLMRRRLQQLGELTHRRSGRFAAAVRGDRHVQELAAGADLLVAVDREAILACWQLARRRRDVPAFFGLSAARATLVGADPGPVSD